MDGATGFFSAIALGVFAHGIFGLLVSFCGDNKHEVSLVIFFLNLILFAKPAFIALKTDWMDFSRIERTVIGVWPALVIVLIGITLIPVDMPKTLIDGPYVFKNDELHVRIQRITGDLPADNFVPHVASEFMLRDISFTENRPMLPGQEVVNRTFLMPLISVYFQSIIGQRALQKEPLGTFEYVGTQWPDVGSLGEGKYFYRFLVVGILLNSLLFLSLVVIARKMKMQWVLLPAALIMATTPYFISQVIFTWPKSLAGYFIILAVLLVAEKKFYWFAGLLFALAYHSHPFAMGFAGFTGLFLIYHWIMQQCTFKNVLEFGGVFVLIIAPWFFWTHIVLDISGDLVGQNFFNFNSWVDFFWVRITNLFTLTMPIMLSASSLNSNTFYLQSNVCIPGIVGLFFVVQSLLWFYENGRENRYLSIWYVLLPLVLMWGIFSVPNVPALHGFQSIFPFMLMVGLHFSKQKFTNYTFYTLVAAQLALNLTVIIARGSDVFMF